MKKLLTVLVIASAMTSCSGSGDAAKTDSANTSTVDTAKKVVDSAAVKVDSTIKAVADTAKVKIDAIADSAKKAVKK